MRGRVTALGLELACHACAKRGVEVWKIAGGVKVDQGWELRLKSSDCHCKLHTAS